MEDRLRELSANGDDLERIAVLADFVMFCAVLERVCHAAAYASTIPQSAAIEISVSEGAC